jgi:transcriptional regulator with XRE-family HTH domain
METDPKQVFVGQRLRKARMRAHLSVGAVAEKMHRSRQTIHSWESGAAMPGVLQFADLMVLYSTSSDIILFGDAPAHLRSARGVLWEIFGRSGAPDPSASRY